MTSTRFQTFSLIAIAVAVLCLLVVQWVPWAVHNSSFSTPGFNMFGMSQSGVEGTTQQATHLWSGKLAVDSNMGSDSQRSSWYSDDWETRDGLWQGVAVLRWGAPLLMLGLLGALATLALVGLDLRRPAFFAAIGTAVVTVVAFIVVVVGMNGFFSETGSSPTWHVGLYFAVLGLLGLAAGTVLLLFPSPGYGVRQKLQEGLSS